MLLRQEFLDLAERYGPFDLDGCCDPKGNNAQVPRFCSSQDSFLKTDFSGLRVFVNPPFSNVQPFIDHYQYIKTRDPSTSAIFVLPGWDTKDWFKKLPSDFQLVKTYPKGSKIFSRPAAIQGQREIPGPTKWPTLVFFDPPKTSTATQEKQRTAATPEHLQALAKASGTSETSLLTFNGKVDDKTFTFLVDSGASRNFVNSGKKMADTVISPVRVKLADGDIIVTSRSATLDYRLTPNAPLFRDEFLVVPLGSFDAILGQQWLKKHNPRINWQDHTLTFEQGQQLKANSQRQTTLQVMTAKKFFKLMRAEARPDVFCAMIKTPEDECTETEDSIFQQLLQSTPNDRIRRLITNYPKSFQIPNKLPPRRNQDHAIDLKPNAEVPPQKVYKMSPSELKEVRRQLTDYTEKGWIRPSKSPYGSPVLFVRKKNGELRMCVDYRELNKITQRNRYPLPRVDEMFDTLSKAKIFSSLDLKSGYNQMRIKEGDEHKTAFLTRYGLFEFLVLPFGLSNAPASFMTLMNNVLRPYIDKFVLVYLDDILVFSETEEEHAAHLQQVLSTLEQHHLFLNAKKCEFGRDQVTFLGHVISSHGISPDPAKVEGVKNWPVPSTLHEIRGFLGFVNFYRKFIPDFAQVALPLTDLTKTTSPQCGKMTPEATIAFHRLKELLTTAPVLIIPETGPTAKFTVITDASDFAIGFSLHQDKGKGLQPVAYNARKLTGAERNYTVLEKELLAIVTAVQVFRTYLDGCKEVKVLTDHKSLTTFFQHKDLQGRRARWAEKLAPYASYLTIEYKRGPENQADGLSRRPDFLTSTTEVVPAWHEELQKAYLEDPLYNGTLRLPSHVYLHDNKYWSAGKLCVPDNKKIRRQLLEEAHSSANAGHPGIKKTLWNIQNSYWWPNQCSEVEHFVKHCPRCQKAKRDPGATPGLLNPHPTPTLPWERVGTDLLTDLPLSNGCDTILVFVDLLTKSAIFIPTQKTITAEIAANHFFKHVYRRFGLPRILISDRDVRFTSRFWTQLFQNLQTTLNFSTAFHPETDGQSERTIQQLLSLLRTCTHPLRDDWYWKLPILEFAFNSSPSSSTGTSPFKALHGFQPRSPLSFPPPTEKCDSSDRVSDLQRLQQDVQVAVERSHQKQKDYADQRRRKQPLTIGDLVKIKTDHFKVPGLHCRKLKDKYAGPYRIIKQKSPVSFELELPEHLSSKFPAFHVDKLRPYFSDDETRFSEEPELQLQPPPDEFVIDRIKDVDLDKTETTLMFHVKWATPHNSDSHDSWVPLDNVTNTIALDEFLRTPNWKDFTTTRDYRAFRRRYPSRVPEISPTVT